MNNKSLVAILAGVALLGPTVAAAECPAFLNAEEGVPCMTEKMKENKAESVATKTSPRAMRDSESRAADIEAWKFMAQNDK